MILSGSRVLFSVHSFSPLEQGGHLSERPMFMLHCICKQVEPKLDIWALSGLGDALLQSFLAALSLGYVLNWKLQPCVLPQECGTGRMEPFQPPEPSWSSLTDMRVEVITLKSPVLDYKHGYATDTQGRHIACRSQKSYQPLNLQSTYCNKSRSCKQPLSSFWQSHDYHD